MKLRTYLAGFIEIMPPGKETEAVATVVLVRADEHALTSGGTGWPPQNALPRETQSRRAANPWHPRDTGSLNINSGAPLGSARMRVLAFPCGVPLIVRDGTAS